MKLINKTILYISATFFACVALAGIVRAQSPDFVIDTQVSGSATVCGAPVTFTVTMKNQLGTPVQNVTLYHY